MRALLAILLISLVAFAKAQTITAAQAKDSIGKTVTVCGYVTGIHSTDKLTFINFDKKYPDNPFTLVVFVADTSKFSYQLSTLNQQDICVTGLIKDFKGMPEIVATNEKQIEFKAIKVTPRE